MALCCRPLGELRFLRLWHNNSGKGDDGSWYCDFAAVIDLQTKQKYIFLVQKWFAVDEEDGLVSLHNIIRKFCQ